jgi:hypothetical protein
MVALFPGVQRRAARRATPLRLMAAIPVAQQQGLWGVWGGVYFTEQICATGSKFAPNFPRRLQASPSKRARARALRRSFGRTHARMLSKNHKNRIRITRVV